MITSLPGVPSGLDRSSVERIVREIVLASRVPVPSQAARQPGGARSQNQNLGVDVRHGGKLRSSVVVECNIEG